ncbi:MAG: hypothetical protein WCQ67_08760 [Treponema sp.]
MMTVRTFNSNYDAERAVAVLKKAGVSAFTSELTKESLGLHDDDSANAKLSGVQVRVVDDAAYKANQILDVLA